MKLTGKIQKVFLCFWAASILWIYIGSLVNFHQHKIWGQPLLTQLIFAKRDKEQSVDFKKLLEPRAPKVITPVHETCAGILQTAPHLISRVSVHVASAPFEDHLLSREILLPSGLRAPPLS